MVIDPIKRIFFLVLLIAGVGCLAIASTGSPSKWIGGAGLIFDIAGIVQLELSGVFEKIFEKYGNEKEYPYGPPSHITRQIIDNPDTPIRSWLRNTLYFEHRTGIYLIVLGFVFQFAALWF